MKQPRARSRRQAERRGHWAESIASVLLRCKGYRVVARRYKTPVGEIDLVARRGRTIAFVEVKQRRDFASAAHAVSPAQMARIARAAEFWRAGAAGQDDLDFRFDVVLVNAFGLPRHMANAFSADGGH